MTERAERETQKWAMDAAKELWADICDRRGLKSEAAKVDDHVVATIFKDWADLIIRHFLAGSASSSSPAMDFRPDELDRIRREVMRLYDTDLYKRAYEEHLRVCPGPPTLIISKDLLGAPVASSSSTPDQAWDCLRDLLTLAIMRPQQGYALLWRDATELADKLLASRPTGATPAQKLVALIEQNFKKKGFTEEQMSQKVADFCKFVDGATLETKK